MRFIGVKDQMGLERKLDNIWIGLYKLRANVARFIHGRTQNNKVKRKVPLNGVGVTDGSLWKVGVTYVDALRNQNKKIWKPKEKIACNKNGDEEWKGRSFTVKEDDMKWLEQFYVGLVNSPNNSHFVQERLIVEGIKTVEVLPMGRNMILLKPEDGENVEELVKETKDIMENIFHQITPWSPTELPRERYMWVRCTKVPMQAWRQEFFEFLVYIGLVSSYHWM